MHGEAEVETRPVRFQLRVDVEFLKVGVKPAETAREDGESNVGLTVLDVIVPDEEILAVCVVVDARVRSVFRLWLHSCTRPTARVFPTELKA